MIYDRLLNQEDGDSLEALKFGKLLNGISGILKMSAIIWNAHLVGGVREEKSLAGEA